MKIHYQISGMHCRSCEILIAQHLRKIPGVKDARASFASGVATIDYSGQPPDQHLVASAIRNAGYSLGNSRHQPLIARDSSVWQELLFALCVVLVLYLFGTTFGIVDFVARGGAATGPTAALILGLTAGVSSCMALIGSLVLGMSARHAELHPEATTAQKFRPHLFFNIGRVVGFALLGGVIGAAGAALQPSARLLGALILGSGILMLFLGVKLLELFPRLSGGLTLPSSIARLIGIDRDVQEYSHARSATLGALTFFLPCGFTQAMQVYAISTGSFTQGALIMSMFALGTMPGLLGIGGLASVVRGGAARIFFKVAGIIVIALGLWNISNGWTLTGIIVNTPTTQAVRQQGRTLTAQVRDNKQYVAMQQNERGYSADRIIVKQNIPVVWQITSTNAYTCASSLMVPAMNIATLLQPGVNTIEFTPTVRGPIRFSCSMGMYRGIIEVIE